MQADYRDFIQRDCPYDPKKNSSSHEPADLSHVTMASLDGSQPSTSKKELFANLGARGMMSLHIEARGTQPALSEAVRSDDFNDSHNGSFHQFVGDF